MYVTTRNVIFTQVETALQNSLDQKLTEAEENKNRWLNAAKEKLKWCQDTAGDKYRLVYTIVSRCLADILLFDYFDDF